MFGPDFYIDTVQGLQRAFTNQVVTDSTLNKVANNFIEAQTVFTKMLANNTTNVAKYSMDSFTKCWFPKKEGTA
jgi:hypothetical protein